MIINIIIFYRIFKIILKESFCICKMISECVYYYPQGSVNYPEILKDALFEYDLGFVTYIFKRKGKFIECYASVHYQSSAVVFSTFYKLPIKKGVKRRLKNITAKLICQTIPTIVFVQREPKYTILYSTQEHDNTSKNYPEIEDSFSDEEYPSEGCFTEFYPPETNTDDLITSDFNKCDDVDKPIPPPRPSRTVPLLPISPYEEFIQNSGFGEEVSTSKDTNTESPNNDFCVETSCQYNSNDTGFNEESNLNCLSSSTTADDFTSFRNEIVERLMSALGKGNI